MIRVNLIGRQGIALILSIVLGYYSNILIQASGYGGIIAFIISSLLCPFIICLIVRQRVILFGLIPNIVSVIFIAIASPYNTSFKMFLEHGVKVFTILLGIGVMFSFIISLPFYFISKHFALNSKRREIHKI